MSTEPRRKRNTVPAVAYKFCEETTVQGLDLINKDRPYIWNVTWFLIFICSMALAVYFLMEIIQIYMNKAMATEYQIMTYNREKHTVPGLYLCTGNRFNQSKFQQLNVSTGLQNVLNDAINTAIPFANKEAEGKLHTEYAELRQKFGASTFEDVLVFLTSSCEDIVEECNLTFTGVSLDGSECCKRHADETLTRYGRCLHFSGKAMEFNKILLRTPRPEEVSFRSTRKLTFDLILYLFHPSEDSYFFLNVLQPGYEYEYIARMTALESVNNPPQYVCRNEADYNHYNCVAECEEGNRRKRVCNCTIPYTFNLEVEPSQRESNKTLCDPWQIANCRELEANASANLDNQQDDLCNAKCPVSCKAEKFTSELHVQPFSRSAVTQMKGGNQPLVDEFLHHRVLVNYHVDKQYQNIRQYFAVSFPEVLSYLGGQLGLFLGCSVITFIHAFVFWIYICLGRLGNTIGRLKFGALKRPSPQLSISRQMSSYNGRRSNTRKRQPSSKSKYEPCDEDRTRELSAKYGPPSDLFSDAPSAKQNGHVAYK